MRIINLLKRENVICPKCGRKATFSQISQPSLKTIKCLNCGYYNSNNVEIFMNISQVNEFRKALKMELISKLLPIKK